MSDFQVIPSKTGYVLEMPTCCRQLASPGRVSDERGRQLIGRAARQRVHLMQWFVRALQGVPRWLKPVAMAQTAPSR